MLCSPALRAAACEAPQSCCVGQELRSLARPAGKVWPCEHQEAVGEAELGQQGAPKQQGCTPSIALLQGVPQPMYNPVPRVPQEPQFM